MRSIRIHGEDNAIGESREWKIGKGRGEWGNGSIWRSGGRASGGAAGDQRAADPVRHRMQVAVHDTSPTTPSHSPCRASPRRMAVFGFTRLWTSVTLLNQLMETWLDPLAALDPNGDALEELLSYVQRKLEMARDLPRVGEIG